MTAYSRFLRVIARSHCDVVICGILEKINSLDCFVSRNDGLVLLEISKYILQSSSFLFSLFSFFCFFLCLLLVLTEKENEFIQFFSHLHFLFGIVLEVFYFIEKQHIIKKDLDGIIFDGESQIIHNLFLSIDISFDFLYRDSIFWKCNLVEDSDLIVVCSQEFEYLVSIFFLQGIDIACSIHQLGKFSLKI